jgi:hypothetical protein
MSQFTAVEINKNIITKFYRNGEIELLRTVDFSFFNQNELDQMVNECYNYMDEVDQTSKNYINILECHKLLQEMSQTDFTWETEKLIISRNCYCTKCSKDFGCTCSSSLCIHKVEDKETNKIFAVFHDELMDVILEENLNIGHFTG